MSEARPPRLTPQLRQELLKWLRAGLPLSLACSFIDVHESNVRVWRARSRAGVRGYRNFDEDVKHAINEGEATLVAQITVAGKTNWRAHAWLLERMNPERWGPPAPPAPIPDAPPLGSESRSDDQAGL